MFQSLLLTWRGTPRPLTSKDENIDQQRNECKNHTKDAEEDICDNADLHCALRMFKLDRCEISMDCGMIICTSHIWCCIWCLLCEQSERNLERRLAFFYADEAVLSCSFKNLYRTPTISVHLVEQGIFFIFKKIQ